MILYRVISTNFNNRVALDGRYHNSGHFGIVLFCIVGFIYVKTELADYGGCYNIIRLLSRFFFHHKWNGAWLNGKSVLLLNLKCLLHYITTQWLFFFPNWKFYMYQSEITLKRLQIELFVIVRYFTWILKFLLKYFFVILV